MKQLLLILCMGMSLSAHAQVVEPGEKPAGQVVNNASIRGTVLDSALRKPVEFATIALLNSTTDTPIRGTTTDSNGQFSFLQIESGMYRLQLSFVGYENRTSTLIVVSTAQPTIALPPLLLKNSNQMLGEVTVTARRELIEDKEDRLVYNAGSDLSNAGGTAIDVLKKTPLLTVDPDGTIQLKGSTSIKVLVNNKPSSIMARSISEALQMIPADIIKSVEVITSPSARYDAEGTAGVINIITKSRLQGLTGGLNATTGNRTNNVGGNINIRRYKVGLTAYGGANMFRNDGGSESVRRTSVVGQSGSELRQTNTFSNRGRSGFGSFNLDYDLDSTNQFGIDGSFSTGNRLSNSIRDTRYGASDTSQSHLPVPFSRYTDNASGDLNLDGNVNYTHLFKRPEQTLTFLTQYNRSANDSRYELSQFLLPQNERINYREHNSNQNRTGEFTLQLDYDHPFKTGNKKLEAGAKSISRHVGSDYRLESATDSTDFMNDPRRANQFDYQQWIVSSYVSFRISTPRKWSYTMGLRYEATRIDANFVSTRTLFAQHYQNLLPNVAISKRLTDNRRLRLSYNQRIQRPSIFFLNPYTNSTDPKNISFGNPYLNPELAHSVEITYSTFSRKGMAVNGSVFSRLTNNAIERVTTVDMANVASNTYQNIARNATYGFNLYMGGQPYKNWQLNGSVGLNYNVLNSIALNIRNTNLNYRISLNTSLSLPSDYSLQAQASYNSARIQLQSQSSGFVNYGLSVRKEFKPSKLVLTLNLENLFSRYNTITTQFRTVTFVTDGSNYNAYRTMRLSANWRFGRLDSKPARPQKRITNDDGKTDN